LLEDGVSIHGLAWFSFTPSHTVG